MKNILFCVLIILVGCVQVPKKAVYFNDSQIILGDKAGTGVCINYKYDCIVMSVGSFRNMTGVTTDPGKKFILVYE